MDKAAESEDIIPVKLSMERKRMQFHSYGDKKNKTILALHGMLCDWQKFRELLKPLEETYYVICCQHT